MKYKKVILLLLILLALGCFYVVYLMYSKLSFIDTPYLYGGLFFLLLAIFLSFKK